jgi:hypothetical protein
VRGYPPSGGPSSFVMMMGQGSASMRGEPQTRHTRPLGRASSERSRGELTLQVRHITLAIWTGVIDETPAIPTSTGLTHNHRVSSLAARSRPIYDAVRASSEPPSHERSAASATYLGTPTIARSNAWAMGGPVKDVTCHDADSRITQTDRTGHRDERGNGK